MPPMNNVRRLTRRLTRLATRRVVRRAVLRAALRADLLYIIVNLRSVDYMFQVVDLRNFYLACMANNCLL